MLLLANAIVGFWEEFQAGNAIAALKTNLALKARVKRDGAWSDVAARELVPGDLVRLRIGDIVPADAKLLAGDPIEVDQSALTGESLPVARKTGRHRLLGLHRAARGNRRAGFRHRKEDLLWQDRSTGRGGPHRQPFSEGGPEDRRFSHRVAVALVILIIAVALFRGDQLMETLQFALVLTVAAVPVAMPTVLSVTMAVGARILARNQAIVSRLARSKSWRAWTCSARTRPAR